MKHVTIPTTTLGGAKKLTDDRIADRMREMCEVVKMEGESFRKCGQKCQKTVKP